MGVIINLSLIRLGCSSKLTLTIYIYSKNIPLFRASYLPSILKLWPIHILNYSIRAGTVRMQVCNYKLDRERDTLIRITCISRHDPHATR